MHLPKACAASSLKLYNNVIFLFVLWLIFGYCLWEAKMLLTKKEHYDICKSHFWSLLELGTCMSSRGHSWVIVHQL